MPTSTPDAEDVVSKLTKAQREAFLRSTPEKMHRDWHGRISTYGDIKVGNELFRLGLITKPGTFSFATELGLACREILQRKGNEHG